MLPTATDFVPVPAGAITVATPEDSLATEWLGSTPAHIAVLRDDDLIIAMSARHIEDHFLMIRIEITNRSDEVRVVNPMVIRALDADRFELPRMRPDEAAARVADLTLSDPQFPPRYIVTTESNTSLFVSSNTALMSTDEVTVVEVDPVDQAAQSFSEGFTDGYNRSIMRTARKLYDEGFTQPITIEPHSGRRGRLFFRVEHALEGIVVRVGSYGEYVARPGS